MQATEIYERNNHGIGFAASAVFRRKGHLIQWSPDNTDTVLDFGCGTGNVLVDVILPAFEGKYSQCYGVDISKAMIRFASEKYAARRDLQFTTMDIYSEVPEFLRHVSPVAHIVSTFALHWLTDLEAGLWGLFDLLKPGGDFLTVHVCSSFLFDLYDTVGQHPRWGRYFDGIEAAVMASHRSPHPERELQDQMVGAGFSEVQVEIMPLKWRFSHLDSLRRLLNSVLVQIENVPDEEVDEFLDYVVSFGIERKGLIPLPNGEFLHTLQLFVAFGRKKGDRIKSVG